jgi:hypothetical protein
VGLAQVGDLALILVGVFLAAIGASLMANFRGSTTWWFENASRLLGVPRGQASGSFSERTLSLIVGGAFVLAGIIVGSPAAIHI